MNETTRTTTTRRRGALAALALASLTALSGCTMISTLAEGGAKPTSTQAEPTSSSTKGPTSSASPAPTSTKTPSPSSSTKPTTSGGGYVDYAKAGPGMCVDISGDVTSTQGFFTVDCAAPHAYELISIVKMPDAAGAPFPGKEQIEQQAEKTCGDQFEAYVGVPYSSSSFAYTYVYPTEATWANGDRDVACFLTGASGGDADDLTGSAAGTKK